MRRGARGNVNLGGMTWQEVLEFNARTGPTKLYPDRDLPIQRSIRPQELLEIRFLNEIRNSFVQESAFYIRREKANTTPVNDDGLVRYSDRNKPKRKNENLRLSDLDLDPKYFPEELRKTLGAESGIKKRARRKLDMKTFIDFTINTEDLKDDAPEAADATNEEVPEEVEDEDEDFGDDDENDYGENYFDNGEGDDFEDYEGDEGGVFD
ncbi:DNA-directed RNA polymerase III complex subunit Rpc31 [Schizosaccharomyces cryophilus OY26]|uniref:DNA-directed RNA polymerase III complex subunit Rpc31 n=1 Tax=Schizosaccharomyces cryophilus (strain OY26 / ATCC MYA-4695 / CBS 11777 / NBRC 106824 / NRRL Y48691) TaxID=653667 RepID=S9X9W8_SCHCR|nr:DNA-directed RNA polymerase III complex subunit Rpc31 [Schizosaccharomyces cryophilus OY26]EPY50561.1 DNA-directed RNA polymerase III complex subunit Rpc31 [Schizosaccharomyces cryophilus OY26]